MRKLALDIESLKVETFATEAGEPADRGTVHGQATGVWNGCTDDRSCQGSCGGWGDCTQYGSCQGSCVQTCGGPTCEPPCHNEPTLYATCGETCSWTNGDAICDEPIRG